MPDTAIGVQELPERFAEVVTLVDPGAEVIVRERAVPRARLVALAPGQPRWAGLHPGAITATCDFDDPLPEELWHGA